jgi:hypothetical protein
MNQWMLHPEVNQYIVIRCIFTRMDPSIVWHKLEIVWHKLDPLRLVFHHTSQTILSFNSIILTKKIIFLQIKDKLTFANSKQAK